MDTTSANIDVTCVFVIVIFLFDKDHAVKNLIKRVLFQGYRLSLCSKGVPSDFERSIVNCLPIGILLFTHT